jgi:hypothetical protein
MSREGDHVKALVDAVVEQTNASEQAAATLALAVVVEQQGAAATATLAEGLALVALAVDHLRDELSALVYQRTGDGR